MISLSLISRLRLNLFSKFLLVNFVIRGASVGHTRVNAKLKLKIPIFDIFFPRNFLQYFTKFLDLFDFYLERMECMGRLRN